MDISGVVHLTLLCYVSLGLTVPGFQCLGEAPESLRGNRAKHPLGNATDSKVPSGSVGGIGSNGRSGAPEAVEDVLSTCVRYVKDYVAGMQKSSKWSAAMFFTFPIAIFAGMVFMFFHHKTLSIIVVVIPAILTLICSGKNWPRALAVVACGLGLYAGLARISYNDK